VAAAAAAVVALGGGLAYVLQNPLTSTNTASAPEMYRGESDTAGTPAAVPAPSALPAVAPGASIIASGTNYTPTALQYLATAPAANAAPGPPDSAGGQKPGELPQEVREAVPSPLARLAEPTGLEQCLRAVWAVHPGTVALLDYARFENDPALVIVIRQVAGRVVVAVGDECGINGSDEKAAIPA
jgi:hypothetical protein